jgi:hypothetical protein
MSRATLAKLGGVAVREALDTVWAQWGCLTHTAAGVDERPVSSIVDVEALVLLSLILQDDERRLRDLLAALARSHSKLLSVHRMQHIGAHFPDDVMPLMHRFASGAKHPSWSKLGKLAEPHNEDPARRKDLGPLRLLHPALLQLRLRTALGIGLKSDLLCYLIGQCGGLSTTEDQASALGYTERNTRIAADDLVHAAFAIRDDYSPRTTYVVRNEAWAPLLTLFSEGSTAASTNAPRWQNWSATFAFLAHVIVTARRAEQGWSDYVIDSRARDLVEVHYPRLIRARVLTWNGQMARESSGIDSLKRIVSETASAMRLAL